MLLSLVIFFLEQSITWPRKRQSLEVPFGHTGCRNTEELMRSLRFCFDNFIIYEALITNSLPWRYLIAPGYNCRNTVGVWSTPECKIWDLCLISSLSTLSFFMQNSYTKQQDLDTTRKYFLLKENVSLSSSQIFLGDKTLPPFFLIYQWNFYSLVQR